MGLSGLALRKVKELQVQQERLQREKQQKQLQLDSTQTALHKQTVMVGRPRRHTSTPHLPDSHLLLLVWIKTIFFIYSNT